MKKSELKEIIKSVVDEWNTEEVHPEGLATYTYTGLQNDLVRKCGDLLERAQQGRFTGIGTDQLKVLANMWVAMSEKQREMEER
jgi:hypothetical protein